MLQVFISLTWIGYREFKTFPVHLNLISTYPIPLWFVDSVVPCLLFTSSTSLCQICPARHRSFYSHVSLSDPLQQMYNRGVPTYLKENLDHPRNRDAPTRTELSFSVADVTALYSCCLDVRRYQEILQQGDAMTFRNESGGKRETMLYASHKRWNYWVIHSAFRFCCSSSKMDSPFVHCWRTPTMKVR